MKNRLARVCEVLKREIGILATRDLDFHGDLATISSVDITPDLKQAHVYISAIGSALRLEVTGITRVGQDVRLDGRMVPGDPP